MALATSSRTATSAQPGLPSIMTLARWRVRQVWLLLLLIGLGMLIAVTLVCSVPLLSEVMTTADLYDTLTATPTTGELGLSVTAQGFSARGMRSIEQQFTPIFRRDAGPYLEPPLLSLQNSGLTMVTPRTLPQGDTLQLFGTTMAQAAPHISLLTGRMPRATNGEVEAMLTPTTAQRMHLGVGSTLVLRCDCFLKPVEMFGGPQPTGKVHVRIVGLFAVDSAQVAFWHGTDFEPLRQASSNTYTLLVPDQSFVAAFDQLARASRVGTVFSPQTFELNWYYHLATSKISVKQLDDFSRRIAHLQTQVAAVSASVQQVAQSGSLPGYPYLVGVSLYNPAPGSFALLNKLNDYRNRAAVANVPLLILVGESSALIIFFISLIANLLIDRQTEAIAVLRSRGASSGQIFGALLIQCSGPGIIALLTGPLLAVIVVTMIARRFLAPAELSGVGAVVGTPVHAALGTGWYALVTVLVAIFASALLLRRVTGMDVLTIRHEAARETHRPLFQRLRLDVIAAIIALTAYAVSLYVKNVNTVLDVRTRTLVGAPLALVAPIFLLLGALLLFLRFFPAIVRGSVWLAGRNRGAPALLALAQMARVPRQSMRMTLLLALAIAFIIFNLVFLASQQQRAADIAAYAAMSDFSGDLPAAVTQKLSSDALANKVSVRLQFCMQFPENPFQLLY